MRQSDRSMLEGLMALAAVYGEMPSGATVKPLRPPAQISAKEVEHREALAAKYRAEREARKAENWAKRNKK